MGIFDNVTSVTINDKEVASIEVDGGVIYTKSSGDSRDITFTVTAMGQPLGANIPVNVDGVTENTDENSQVVFNLVDGNHTVKIIESEGGVSFTSYYNDAIVTNASHTEYSLEISDSRDLSYEFVDEVSKEVISDVQYYVEFFDIVSETILAKEPRKTGDVQNDFIAVPIRFRIYTYSSSSEVLDEKSIDRNYEGKITFEVRGIESQE